jgi:hypothetical protein
MVGSEIRWPREPDTPSFGIFVKERPNFSRINLPSLVLLPEPLGSCREALRLLFNKRNVFKIGILYSKTSKIHNVVI